MKQRRRLFFCVRKRQPPALTPAAGWARRVFVRDRIEGGHTKGGVHNSPRWYPDVAVGRRGRWGRDLLVRLHFDHCLNDLRLPSPSGFPAGPKRVVGEVGFLPLLPRNLACRCLRGGGRRLRRAPPAPLVGLLPGVDGPCRCVGPRFGLVVQCHALHDGLGGAPLTLGVRGRSLVYSCAE